MRGEKTYLVSGSHWNLGSSPHARGKVLSWKIFLLVLRIIPACAGKRGSCLASACMTEDHPRMRGEKKTVT